MLSPHRFTEDSTDADRRRIELTTEQSQDQIKEASERNVHAIELKLENLEERVAPATSKFIEVNSPSFGV